MHATAHLFPGAWLIMGSIAFVFLVAFGGSVCRRLKKLNRKYHLIVWDDHSIDSNYAWDDDDE